MPVSLSHHIAPAVGDDGGVSLIVTPAPPPDAGLDTQPVPSLVRTLPAVPADVNPVPPLVAGSVPDAVDTFTGGRMLERVVIPCSFLMS